MGSNMLLTIGAIILFGLFLSLSDKLMIGNNQIASQNEYYVTGLALAQSVIDEAKAKVFDQSVNGVASVPLSAMTSPASLGPEGAGETFAYPDNLTSSAPYSSVNPGYLSAVKFNDVDDYNGYSRTVNTPRAEGYQIRVSVKYASETAPDSVKNARTFCKVMTVKVTSPFFPKLGDGGGVTVPDTLTIKYAFTY
jgi:hypothetical protein